MNWKAEEQYTDWVIKDGETVIAKEINSGRDMGETHAKLIAKVPQKIDALKDCKTVFLQLDTRHNGKCYNKGMEENCQCTLCKINRVLP